MTPLATGFAELMARNAEDCVEATLPRLTPALGRKLIGRIDSIRLFAHSYSFIHNMTHGRFAPSDLIDFAYEQELAGICLHIDDGGERSLQAMTGPARRAFAERAAELGLAVHLEASDTRAAEVDRLVETQAISVRAISGSTRATKVHYPAFSKRCGATSCASPRPRSATTFRWSTSSTRTSRPERSPGCCGTSAAPGSTPCSTSATC